MPRPCDCDRFHSPDYRPGDCRLCWLAAHDARYRRLWGVVGEVRGVPRPAPLGLPCVHQGHTCAPPPGGSVVKTWLRCDAGKGSPVAGIVCRCECNPGCPSYEAPED